MTAIKKAAGFGHGMRPHTEEIATMPSWETAVASAIAYWLFSPGVTVRLGGLSLLAEHSAHLKRDPELMDRVGAAVTGIARHAAELVEEDQVALIVHLPGESDGGRRLWLGAHWLHGLLDEGELVPAPGRPPVKLSVLFGVAGASVHAHSLHVHTIEDREVVLWEGR